MDLLNFMRQVPKIDIHEHFSLPDNIISAKNTLSTLGSMSYLGFYDFYPGLKSPRFPKNNLQYPIENSPFLHFLNSDPMSEAKVCLNEGLKSIYQFEESKTSNNDNLNYNQLDQEIRTNYQSQKIYQDFVEKYNIRSIFCDIPHSDIGDSLSNTLRAGFPSSVSLFPFLRINSLLFAFDPTCWTPQTDLLRYFCSSVLKTSRPETFDDFLTIIDKILVWAPQRFIGFKCASAYERTLDFGGKNFTLDEGYSVAKKCYGHSLSEISIQDWLTFGNYIVHYLFTQFPIHHLPFQVHTGTAIPEGSDPQLLRPLLEKYPDVPVELLHAGYPNTNTAIQMVVDFPQVYSDFVWLPHLNHTRIQEMVSEIQKNNCWDRIMAFGGDCACVEGSTGALEILIQNLALGFETLKKKEIIDRKEIEEIIEKIFWKNPNRFFFHT